MLAVAHAQRDEHAEAVAHLERAIALNPENRALARTDPDLEPLRDDDAFRAALEAPSWPAVRARRRPIRDPIRAIIERGRTPASAMTWTSTSSFSPRARARA